MQKGNWVASSYLGPVGGKFTQQRLQSKSCPHEVPSPARALLPSERMVNATYCIAPTGELRGPGRQSIAPPGMLGAAKAGGWGVGGWG